MSEITATHADVLADAAARIRRLYRERLRELYALPHNPYEPGDASHIHLVIVLDEPFDAYDESEQLSRLVDTMNRRYAGERVIFQHIADNELAEYARRDGVRL